MNKRPTPQFDLLPAHTPGMCSKIYAGIGSRRTPDGVLVSMGRIARWLALREYTLRSGGARGADSAFAEGAFGSRQEIFYTHDATSLTRNIAKEIHPAPEWLGTGALDLMARNTFQIFGRELLRPVDFVLCWTPDGCTTNEGRGRRTGGTGQAIDMAARKGIPVINMKNEGWQQEFERLVA